MDGSGPIFTNDAAVLGVLAVILGAVFYTEGSKHPFWRKFYSVVPALLLCYLLPAVANTIGLIDGDTSQLYYVSSRYLLPACLVLLTLSTDIPGVLRLGPKALIMFLTGTAGIVIGGPVALWVLSVISPESLGAGPTAIWRGMTTIAGSWIGGGANQTAMKVVFEVDDDLFGQMVTVDVIWASVWLAVLLFLAGRARQIDMRMGADVTAIEELKVRVQAFHDKHARILNLRDLMLIAAVGFGFTGLAHVLADGIAPWLAEVSPALDRLSLTSEFFWIVIITTTAGLILSFTRVRELEGAGASRIGSGFLYILIASIGMKMDIGAILDKPILFLIGAIWIGIHAGLLLVMARIIRAPLFYVAVGSQANVGGAASAPVVASAFHPTLAPVGVLLAVLGYTLGTYAAWFTGQLMRLVSGGA